MKTLICSIALALSGCASLKPMDFVPKPGGKAAGISCVSYDTITTPDIGILNMEIDKGVVENGELYVQCGQNSVKFTNKPK